MTHTTRAVTLVLVVSFIATSFPNFVSAQSRRSYDRQAWEQWREELEDSDDTDEFDSGEQVSSSRRGTSSATQRKINDLDDDEVEDLPIPILFAVALGDLFKNFGDPRGDGSRSHEGLDIMAREGTPVVSPTEAVVLRTGTGSSAGKYVYTANPGGETFAYMHLSKIADIDVGDELEEGDVIGYVGNTGNASGGPPHLHFEIRKSRTAYDPFPRLTKVFTLKEKMSFVDDILKDDGDEEEYAEFLVENFRGEFLSAKALNLKLPEEITDALGDSVAVVSGSRDLTIGATGPDVILLQSFLLTSGFSIPAGATGYFGEQTRSALARYQAANGITPSVGYYGPLTRARIAL